ncbi:MAG: Flagellin [Alphaproteobacteria bacterium MarineAlpha2_Bin1]|nr:MAG: Flagellin [Alphaproteobacteria bacterium MarineAlpha2_Bin1]
MVKLSLITNTNANILAQELARITKEINSTQLNITSGLKINGPSDDAASFSIATRLRGDRNGLNAVKLALANGETVVDTAVIGANAINEILTEIKSKVVQGNQASLDAATRTSLNDDITSLLNQITTTVGSSEFDNINLIKTDASTLNILSSVKGSVIRVSAQILDITALGVNAISVLTSGSAATALTNINTAITLATDRVAALTSSAKGVEIQSDFTSSLINVFDEGIGKIVNSNLAEESAKLQALQIQQELAVQGLSIANSVPNLILKMFDETKK